MSTPKEKVKYVCVIHNGTALKHYYRKELLWELGIWGRRRRITENTFKKKAKEGYTIEYVMSDELPKFLKDTLSDIDAMIELSLIVRDEKWFMELTERKKGLLSPQR
jgi:hypothetical protein